MMKSYIQQSASVRARELLLLRQQQMAMGGIAEGAGFFVNSLRYTSEDVSTSESEDDAGRERWDFMSFVRKKHLLRPLRPESQTTWLAWGLRRVPLLSQLRQVSCASIASDLIAGLTVGVMGVPESLSYASIAALPFEYGLYALVMPQLIYSLLGQSRQLMVGPVAMLSLLVHAGLEGSLDTVQCPEWFELKKNETAEAFGVLVQSEVCQEKYIAVTILTSLLAGSVLLLACVLQLGFLLKFLGHPVVSGFSTGSALIIMISQFKNFLGVKVEESEFPILSILSLIEHAPHGQPITLAFGLVFTATLVALRKFGYAYPRWKLVGSLGPLISCVSGVLLIYFCKPLQNVKGLDYVHEVPGGSLPTSISIMSSWTAHDVAQTMPLALSVGFLGFLEAFATAQNLAKQHGYQVESSQELLALGASNVIGAIFTAYPATGSFSRSAVCNSTGGKSQLSGVTAASLSFLALLYLTPLFYYLPKFALAAIVVSSVSKLVAYDVAMNLYRVKKADFTMWMTAMIGTLCVGPRLGISLAALLSLLIVIYESIHPPIQVLWRVEGTNSYRNIQQAPEGAFMNGIFIVRIGGSLYFANVAYVEETLSTLISDMRDISEVRYLVLDFTPVVTADYSAMEALHSVIHDFLSQGIQVAFSCVGERLERSLRKFGLLDYLGEDWLFHSVHESVMHCVWQDGDPLSKATLQQEREEALRELEHAEQRCLQLHIIDRGSIRNYTG